MRVSGVSNSRKVEFFLHPRPSSPYVELCCADPAQRWSFPFQFLDHEDLGDALDAAGLTVGVAEVSARALVLVSDEQLDVLAYWMQGGARF